MAVIRPLMRLIEYKTAHKRKFERVVQWMEEFHLDHINRVPGQPPWPDWCFVPTVVAMLVTANLRTEADIHPGILQGREMKEAEIATALATWRMTQGFYRFDATVFDGLWETPVEGDIPTEVLTRLPEWCVYLEVPDDAKVAKAELKGFFAYLDHWETDNTVHLVVVFDFKSELVPDEVPLTRSTLEECLRTERVLCSDPRFRPFEAHFIEPVLSLLLYLCSANAEIVGEKGGQPRRPQPKKTKTGMRLSPAEAPRRWDVAYRLGAAIRHAEASAAGAGTGGGKSSPHARPRPHIRRAHWHSYWVGSRSNPDERQILVKWLPPIPVNVEGPDDLVTTIHPVS